MRPLRFLAALVIVIGTGCAEHAPRLATVRAVVTTTSSATTTSTSSTTTTTAPPRRVTPATVPAKPAPRPAVPLTRAAGQASAPSSGQSLGTFQATCYGAFEGYGGHTASGQQAGPGSIATDPRVIPMGTHLRVEGYGVGVANDVGGAIKGHRIDVWFRTAAECSAWGTRSVEVWAT